MKSVNRKKWWQTALSHVKDVYLESTSSIHNRELHVILSEGRYQLCTAKAVYSFEDKYINFKKSFDWIEWKKYNIEKVLILGLGLGSVIQMLEQKYKRDFEYHAVEIDGKIIELANKYVLRNLNSPIQIFETDALHYVNISQEKYDLIIMDVFDSDKVPVQFENIEFLDALFERMNEKSYLLFNRLNLTEKDHDDTKKYFNEIFKKKFQEGDCCDIEGNYMLVNRKDFFSLRNS